LLTLSPGWMAFIWSQFPAVITWLYDLGHLTSSQQVLWSQDYIIKFYPQDEVKPRDVRKPVFILTSRFQEIET
jgi:hypothetical protein